MQDCFISLVGGQTLGTWQSWGALAKKIPNIPSFLLATPSVRKEATNLKDFAIKHGFGEVTILEIPQKLDREDSAPQKIIEIVTKISAGRCYFCLNGGLNYMVSACVLALAPYKPILLQATLARMLSHDTRENSYEIWPMADPLPVEEIFKLQGVSYSLVEPPKSLYTFCQERKIALPDSVLRGVRIGDITFDFVWNPQNNRLTFLKDCRYPPQDGAERSLFERNIGHWASDRTRSNQMYDKECRVIVRDPKTEERLKKESDNKLTVCSIASENGFNDNNALASFLKKSFEWKPALDQTGVLNPPRPKQQDPLPDNTLVVVLGERIDSTLVAILSHKPKHLVLCYTDKDSVVCENLKNFQTESSSFGIESFLAIPTTIEGTFLDVLLPKAAENARIAVNITPGSKGQGAALTLWAYEHGHIVWSIDNYRRVCVPITGNQEVQPIPLSNCDPLLLFRCKGETILEEGVDATKMPDKEFAKLMLKLMRKAVQTKNENRLFHAPLVIDGISLEPEKKGQWVLKYKGASYPFSTRDGEWFEHVAAMALLQIGAHHSRARMRLRWNEKNEKSILDRYGDELAGRTPHRLDLDVVGALKNDVILISCKAFTKNRVDETVSAAEIEAAAEEARFTGTTLGRFCLRMLAHISCKKPYIYEETVMVFGWKELCQPEVFRELIETLRKEKSTST